MDEKDTQVAGSYRLFVTNGRGRIDRVSQEVRAISDEGAITQAIALVGDAAFELWIGSRQILVKGRGERDANRLDD